MFRNNQEILVQVFNHLLKCHTASLSMHYFNMLKTPISYPSQFVIICKFRSCSFQSKCKSRIQICRICPTNRLLLCLYLNFLVSIFQPDYIVTSISQLWYTLRKALWKFKCLTSIIVSTVFSCSQKSRKATTFKQNLFFWNQWRFIKDLFWFLLFRSFPTTHVIFKNILLLKLCRILMVWLRLICDEIGQQLHIHESSDLVSYKNIDLIWCHIET